MKKKIETKYPSDLTDKEWEEICLLFKGMRRRTWSNRELTNAVFYIQKQVASGDNCRMIFRRIQRYRVFTAGLARAVYGTQSFDT